MSILANSSYDGGLVDESPHFFRFFILIALRPGRPRWPCVAFPPASSQYIYALFCLHFRERRHTDDIDGAGLGFLPLFFFFFSLGNWWGFDLRSRCDRRG
jgi:hypothetical protein